MRFLNTPRSLLAFTLAVAMVLGMVPLPDILLPIEPYWVALVLIYWALETKGVLHLGGAFLTGLVLDVLQASLMGLHALSLVVMVYLVQRFRPRLRFFPPWQQALAVLVLLLNDRIILLWVLIIRGEPLPQWTFWLPPLMGTALWPWIFLLLDRMRSGLRQRNR